MFGKQTGDRFEKGKVSEVSPGPGSYDLPSTLDNKGAILDWAERFQEMSESGSPNPNNESFAREADSSLMATPTPRPATPRPSEKEKDNKENRMPAPPLSARGKGPVRSSSPRSFPQPPSKPSTTAKAPPGPPASLVSDADARKHRDLRLASQLDMVREELKNKSKEAKELQLSMATKDRRIDELQKKMEELGSDCREARRSTAEVEGELATKRRQLHDKEQELLALQRKHEHLRSQNEDRSKRADKKEEEFRTMSLELQRAKACAEAAASERSALERDAKQSEQKLHQQQRRFDELEGGLQSHIEVLEEQLAREVARRREMEAQQEEVGAERHHGECRLEESQKRCDDLQRMVEQLQEELKAKIATAITRADAQAKLEDEVQTLRAEKEASLAIVMLMPLETLVLHTGQTLGLASLEFGAGRGGSSDGPKSGACSLQLLELLGNSDFDNFTACVETQLNQSDPLLDGSSAAAYADCWCAGNVSSFIRAQDCQNQRTWKWLAKVSCDDDCSSTEAQHCAATCPKKCFDMDSSKLPECQCVSGCMQHLRCLVQELGNSTSQESGQECSELALASSSALQTFQQCVRPAGSNSTWDLMTKKFSCLCAGDLQEEIYRHHCCDNSNKSVEFMSTGLCTANCSVDCTGEEAQECQATCTRECAGSHAQKPSEECESNCLKESGRCNRYKVCAARAEIAPAAAFPYVCDDGQEPNVETGCCPGVYGGARCPLLCEVQFKRTFWRPGHSYARCECGSCPATRAETLKLMNETLLSVYEQAAYRQLMYIVVTRHLNGMSFEMRRLFSQQIQAVQTEIISQESQST
ncbi:RDH13 [Symbiodinium sp. CCMP2592]|nr:RDH13 [Symbiodinium sp. CCMP2592]